MVHSDCIACYFQQHLLCSMKKQLVVSGLGEDHAATSVISWLTDERNHFNLIALFTTIKKWADFDMDLVCKCRLFDCS